jgi:hypothetical protein
LRFADGAQILQKSVDSMLERGQKLEDLVMQSNQLSMQVTPPLRL